MLFLSLLLSQFVGKVYGQSCSNPVSLITNEAPPNIHLDGTQFASMNLLTITVRSKIVDGRSDSSSSFSFVGSNNNCVPVNNWSRNLLNDTCEESWEAIYNWNNIRDDCGFNYDNSGSSDVFTGTIKVSQQDVLGSIRGVPQTRLSETDLSLKLSFDNEKEFTANIGLPVVYAPILVVSAVTEAKWNRADNLLSMVIYNSVQYPFSLSVPYSANVDFIFTGNPEYDGSTDREVNISYSDDSQINCPSNIQGAPCQRIATLELTPGEGTCVLDGLYSFEMIVSCGPSTPINECPIDPNNNIVIVQVQLETGNLCGSVDLVTDESSLSLVLTTHADNTFSLPLKTGFFAYQDIFVKTLLSSNRVSIANSDLKEIKVDGVLLYGNGVISENGTVADFALVNPVESPTGGINGFKFKPIASLFAVAEDQKRALPITVTVRGRYKNSGSKRALLIANKNNKRQQLPAGESESDKSSDISIELSLGDAATNSQQEKENMQDSAASGVVSFSSFLIVLSSAMMVFLF